MRGRDPPETAELLLEHFAPGVITRVQPPGAPGAPPPAACRRRSPRRWAAPAQTGARRPRPPPPPRPPRAHPPARPSRSTPTARCPPDPARLCTWRPDAHDPRRGGPAVRCPRDGERTGHPRPVPVGRHRGPLQPACSACSTRCRRGGGPPPRAAPTRRPCGPPPAPPPQRGPSICRAHGCGCRRRRCRRRTCGRCAEAGADPLRRPPPDPPRALRPGPGEGPWCGSPGPRRLSPDADLIPTRRSGHDQQELRLPRRVRMLPPPPSPTPTRWSCDALFEIKLDALAAGGTRCCTPATGSAASAGTSPGSPGTRRAAGLRRRAPGDQRRGGLFEADILAFDTGGETMIAKVDQRAAGCRDGRPADQGGRPGAGQPW